MAALRKKKFESLIKKEERRGGGGSGDKKPRRSSTPPLLLPANIVGETGTSPTGGGDDPAGSPGTAPAAAAAVSPPHNAEVKSPAKEVSGAARIPNRSSSSSEERREERAKTSRLLANGSLEEPSRTNSHKNASTGTSSKASHLGDGAPQAQAVSTKAAGGSSEGGPAPKHSAGEKAREREKLREQLQKLVSNKLSTLGDLDHAGLVALEALSKMPPPPGTTVSKQTGSPPSGGNAGSSGRPRKNLPPGLEKVPRFTGKNLGALSDTLNRFHSLVVAALPGIPLQTVNRALLRDVVFILEGSALKFYDELKGGQIQWEPVPPGAGGAAATEHQAAAKPYFQPPSTWAQVCEAFHDHYLPAQGIARTAETLVSLSQAPGESVRSLAARQLGLTHHLNRLIASDGGRTSFWDAMSIGLFERALRLDLRRMQNTESPCSSFENSVNRAERNAALADTVVQGKEDGGGGGGGGGTAVKEGGSGSDGKLHSGEKQGHARPTASTSGLHQQQQDASRPSSDGIWGSAGVPSAGVAAAAVAAAAEEDAPKNVGIKRSVSQMSDDLVTVKCEGAGAGTDSLLLVGARRALSDSRARRENGDGSNDGKDGDGLSYLNGGDAASDFLGDGGPQPFEGASHGAMLPVADDGPMPPRPWRQEAGGREWSGDFGGSREDWKRKNKNERRRQRDWHQGNAGEGNCPRPIHGDLVGDRPPCAVPQCKAINRQFHCTNECFYHPEHGKYGRTRGGGRRRPPRAIADRVPSEYNGYNNFGFQHAPYTDTFGMEHYS